MSIKKIIEQNGCTYKISEFGNRTFRVSYRYENGRHVNRVNKIFETEESAEAYIRQISNTDALIAQINKK